MYDNSNRGKSYMSQREGRYVKNDQTKTVSRDAFRDKRQDAFKETKRELIKSIYSTLDISKFNFEILRSESQLGRFIEDNYFVSPNYTGKNCFLVFTKIKTKYYTFMVDRRQLSYRFDNLNTDDVYIIQCNADVDQSVYQGTIFDGAYIIKGGEHQFMITDVYQFRGSNYVQGNLDHKLFELKMYLDNTNVGTKDRDVINTRINLELKINKIKKVSQLREFLNVDMKEIESQYQVRGLCFYPQTSGTKLVYIFNDNPQSEQKPLRDRERKSSESDIVHPVTLIERKLSHRIQKDSDGDSSGQTTDADYSMQRSKRMTKRVFTAQTDKPIYAILEMQATKTADNYKMFALERITENESTRYRKFQMDIAYVPNIKKSKWCKDITISSPKGAVFVKCVWRDDKKKWEPLEEMPGVKLPTLIDSIKDSLIEMEISDSESDEE